MKTKEFIEQVEKMGYKTEKTCSFINIYDADNMTEQVAGVNMYCTSQLFIYDAYYHLAKFIVEYAETPLAEREDEKKYYVKVPHTEDLWYYEGFDGKLQTICQGDNKLWVAFTEEDIEKYGLQDCEREEVTDDDE